MFAKKVIKITTKYYNASNNFSAPIKREPRPYSPYSYRSEVIVPERQNNIETEPRNEPAPAVKNSETAVRELSLKTDDLLLIGLIILLLPSAKDNLLLILILGYLLISGMNF